MTHPTQKPRDRRWNYGGPNWKLSRSKIDLFVECPRCFYIDNKLGIKRPQFPSFLLNSAVDTLFKKEFDVHRANQTKHPIMEKYGVDALPFQHPQMDTWRENFEGVQYVHPSTGMIISGAVDDIWVTPSGELLIVDYKSTSKEGHQSFLESIPHDYALLKLEQPVEIPRNNYPILVPDFRENNKDVAVCGYKEIDKKDEYYQMTDSNHLLFSGNLIGQYDIDTHEGQSGSPVHFMGKIGEEKVAHVVGIHKGQDKEASLNVCTLLTKEIINKLKEW